MSPYLLPFTGRIRVILPSHEQLSSSSNHDKLGFEIGIGIGTKTGRLPDPELGVVRSILGVLLFVLMSVSNDDENRYVSKNYREI